MYTAVARRYTRSVDAVNGRVHGHIHGTYTAVHTGRKHGRLHDRKDGRVHGHGRTMYMARARPCTQSVHDHGRPSTDCAGPPSAVHKLCTQPYMGHADGPSVSRTRPCTEPVRGKTWPGTRPVPDRVRTVYMAAHGPYVYGVHGRIHGRVYTAAYTRPSLRPVCTAVYVPCTRRVRTMYTAVHGPSITRTRPCARSCTLYTAVFTARIQYTARKRPGTAIYMVRTPSCTRAVNTAVYTTVNTAVYTVTDGPCTWPVHGRVHSLYRLCPAALGRVQTVYTAVHGPCRWSDRVPNTAVYAAGTWQNTAGYAARAPPCTYRIHGRARAVYRVHGHLHGRLYGPSARPCTYHVHGRAWSVHDPNMAVYTVVYPVHGRVYGTCTRPCTVYMHVFVACVYGRPRPCTDCVRAIYMVRS